MSRYQRALQHVDIDQHARHDGFQGAAERYVLTRLHAKLGQGERLTRSDIERLRPFYPRTPVEILHRYANGVNAGAAPRDRQDRLTEIWAMSVGVPAHQIPAVCEQARRESESLAVQEFAVPLTGRMEKQDQHRDRQNGIDTQARIEAAKRAALSPEAQRHDDVARAVARHEGPQPALYAADRRELVAQKADRNVERMRAQQVRNADTRRDPMRSDDRCEDIGLAMDCLSVVDAASDERAIAENPLLESVDNALTYADSMERE